MTTGVASKAVRPRNSGRYGSEATSSVLFVSGTSVGPLLSGRPERPGEVVEVYHRLLDVGVVKPVIEFGVERVLGIESAPVVVTQPKRSSIGIKAATGRPFTPMTIGSGRPLSKRSIVGRTRAADYSDRARDLIAEALREALGADPPDSRRVHGLIDTAGLEAGAGRHARTLTGVRAKGPRRSAVEAVSPDLQWEQYRQTLVDLSDTEDVARTVDDADRALRRLRESSDIDAESQPILAALADPEAAEILEMALENVTRDDPELLTTIRDGVLPAVHRAPVGLELRLLTGPVRP